MSIDKEKLKALAEAAQAWSGEIGELRWYEADCFKQPYFGRPDAEFLSAASPVTVLALLAEIERLEKCLFMESAELAWSDSDGRAIQAERDQLKAENEALRKAVTGKVVCDVDLFEDLRDSAASEADEHRQHMAAYRPQRQEVLDWTVRRCDLLLAATKEEPHG